MILTTTTFLLLTSVEIADLYFQEFDRYTKEYVIREQVAHVEDVTLYEIDQPEISQIPFELTFDNSWLMFIWKKEKEYGITKAPKV